MQSQDHYLFQHAEPPEDQICQVAFQNHKLHRFYAKSAHQMLRSFEMTHTQNRQIRENFLHAEFPVLQYRVHRFCPPPVIHGFYGDKVKYFHCKQYRFHILLTWEAIDSFNHRLGHVNALLYYNHTVPLKNPSQVRRVLPCSDSTGQQTTLSQIYPHSNWNSKLNTRLRLEFQVEYRFKLELQVEWLIRWESVLCSGYITFRLRVYMYDKNACSYHSLPKLWRYNKASLGELVPLEILVVSTRFNLRSLAATHLLYQLDSSNEVCKGLTKSWSSKNHLVVSSEFWKSAGFAFFPYSC